VNVREVAAGDDTPVGDVLLSQAADSGCDLIVMGAYAHSRLHELVMGGATRTVLRSMTVPVLLSH
jgi:nucleotide-binding universal stress UspA family protein